MNGALNLVSESALEKAVSLSVPKGTQALNLDALRAGVELGRQQSDGANTKSSVDAGEQDRETR